MFLFWLICKIKVDLFGFLSSFVMDENWKMGVVFLFMLVFLFLLILFCLLFVRLGDVGLVVNGVFWEIWWIFCWFDVFFFCLWMEFEIKVWVWWFFSEVRIRMVSMLMKIMYVESVIME